MADPRFFTRAGPFELAQLAEIGEAKLADPDQGARIIEEVAPLETADSSELAFLDNVRYLPALAATGAGAVVLAEKHRERAPAGTALLVSDNPYRSYALIARAFYPAPRHAAERHPTALVDPEARVDESASLGAYAVVEAGAEIGAGCRIGHHAVVGSGVVLGSGTEIGPGATLSHCLVGRDCLIHAGVRIGNRGFGFALDPRGYVDVPQLGRVLVGDRVEIGANATLDRGSGPDTVIGDGAKIDNLVQIGHNVAVGRGSVLVAQSGVAGSSRLEDFSMLGAQAGIAGHLTVGRGAKVGAQAGVMRDVPAGDTQIGSPAMTFKDGMRLFAIQRQQVGKRGRGDG